MAALRKPKSTEVVISAVPGRVSGTFGPEQRTVIQQKEHRVNELSQDRTENSVTRPDPFCIHDGRISLIHSERCRLITLTVIKRQQDDRAVIHFESV